MKKILRHGKNHISTDYASEVSLDIQGTTLIPMSNSKLKSSDYYVLANKDGKTSVKIGNKTYNGVAKFKGNDSRATFGRKITFDDKAQGSTFYNPHVIVNKPSQTLLKPTDSNLLELNQDFLNKVSVDDLGITNYIITETVKDNIPQFIVSLNIVEEIEREFGKIPYATVSGKKEWIKAYVDELNFSVVTKKAKANVFIPSSSSYDSNLLKKNDTNTINSLDFTFSNDVLTTPKQLKDLIDDKGYIHFIVYGDVVTSSTAPSSITVGFINANIKLNSNQTLQIPRLPLYKVTEFEYESVLSRWGIEKTCNLFPPVDGVQDLVNPYIGIDSESGNELFGEITLRGLLGKNDSLNKSGDSWIHVKYWEKLELAVNNNRTSFDELYSEIVIINKADKTIVEDFVIEDSFIKTPSIMVGNVTVYYSKLTPDAIDVTNYVHGKLTIYGDSDIYVTSGGSIYYSQTQNSYQYDPIDRDAVFGDTPNVQHVMAEYRQLLDSSLGRINMENHSNSEAVEGLYTIISNQAETIEALHSKYDQIYKLLQSVINK